MPKTSKPRKHGSRWEINWIDFAGKRRFASFATYKGAERALRQRQVEADDARGGVTPPPEPEHTFAELEALWMDVKHRKRSLKDDESRIRCHLSPTFGTAPLQAITPTRIADLERRLSRRMSTQSVRLVLAQLRAMLRLAEEHGWLRRAPKVRLPKADPRDYVWIRSEEQMRRFLQAAEGIDYPGLMPFYATALYTGMRAGELCGLEWADVDLDRRLITVQRSFRSPPKSGRIRHVPILDPLLHVLQAWRLASGGEGIVFPNESGNMHVSNARPMKQIFLRCQDLAEIEPHVRFHDLRHTFASHWVLRGGDIFKLQQILGHAGIEMTLRYAHLAPTAFQQDLGRFADVVPRPGEGKVIELDEAFERARG